MLCSTQYIARLRKLLPKPSRSFSPEGKVRLEGVIFSTDGNVMRNKMQTISPVPEIRQSIPDLLQSKMIVNNYSQTHGKFAILF